MSNTRPQPPGGGPITLNILQSAATEATLVVHNPPDVPANSQVLGICAVPEEYADPNNYGWMVADFVAWKAIFYGVGTRSSQTWLSSLNIANFLDGSRLPAEMTQKVLGIQNDHIGEIPTNSMECATALFTRISERAQEANKNGTCLLLMFFAPTTAEQDVCIDFGGPEGAKAFLTTEKIRGVIRDAVGHDELPVVLLTPSPFTGGWVCNPSLFARPNASVTSIDSLIRFVSKSCGAVFANRIIRFHTTRGTPFISDAEREKVRYDDMMPIRPTEEQLSSLHDVHRKIHETLEHRLSVLAGKHSFNFDTAKDNWITYGPRKSFPLAKWQARWNRSADRIYDENAGFPFLGEAFGGTRASQLFHIKYLVFIELQTCPGDWDRPVTGGTRDLFMKFMEQNNPDEDTIKRVFDAVEYRSSSMTMAQILVKGFGLPLPDGLRCRYWTDKTAEDDNVLYRKLQLAFSEIHNLFDYVALLPGETRHEYKDLRFWRPSRWMAASIASHFAGGSNQDIVEFVQEKVAPLMRLVNATQKSLLLEDDSIKQLGSKWIASLGLEPDFASTAHDHHPEQSQGHTDNKRKRVASDNTNNTNAELTATEQPLLKKTVQNHGVKPVIATHGHSKQPVQPITQHDVEKLDAKIAQTIIPPVAKLTVNPVASATSKPAAEPVAKANEKIAKGLVKVAPAGTEGGPIGEPVNQCGSKITINSAPVLVNKPVQDSTAKSLPGNGADVNHTSIKDGGGPSGSKINAAPAAVAGPTIPGISASELANVDLETLLKGNPVVLAQVLAKALELLKIQEGETRTAANSGAGPSTTAATAEATTSETATLASNITEGIPEDAATGARASKVSRSPAEAHDAPLGSLDPNKPEGSVRSSLLNPTPPRTPTNGRGVERSSSQSGPGPQRRGFANGKLADENDFFKAVKW